MYEACYVDPEETGPFEFFESSVSHSRNLDTDTGIKLSKLVLCTDRPKGRRWEDCWRERRAKSETET